jgi:hypothetical protein
MKTLSRIFPLVAVAAIALGAILPFRLLAESPTPSATPAEPTYSLVIGTKTSPGTALAVTDPVAFKKLLDDNGQPPNGVTLITPTPGPSPLNRTGVNVTQRITSNDATFFQQVLNSFAPPPKPSPTATATASPTKR